MAVIQSNTVQVSPLDPAGGGGGGAQTIVLTATAGVGQVTLDWTASTPPDGGSFTIYRGVNGAPLESAYLAGGESRSYVDVGEGTLAAPTFPNVYQYFISATY
jgi:hypothetical protein